MARRNVTKSQTIRIFALQNDILSSVHINLDPRVIAKIYWALPVDTPIRKAVAAVQDSPLQSVLVVSHDGQVVGALTTNEAVSVKCKGPKRRCQEDCESACADRGGCAFVISDSWGNCMWECKDEEIEPEVSMEAKAPTTLRKIFYP